MCSASKDSQYRHGDLEQQTESRKNMHLQIKAELQMELKPEKMRRLVREFGQFPAAQRPVIWRYLLNIPHNTSTFRQMLQDVPLSKLPQPWSEWIASNKTISKTTRTYIIRMLRWLLAWSPQLSVAKFLPDFILPFVRMFRTDPMTCFELVATVIQNWGQHWLQMCAQPPLDLMCLTEQLLRQHGAGSLKILIQHKVNVTTYAWSLLEHGFSRTLTTTQWAQMWDHLLAHSPTLMFAAAVAYVATTENSLRQWAATKGDVQGFYWQPGHVDMRQFLRMAYEIMDSLTQWPTQLTQPLMCLPVGAYPCLLQETEKRDKAGRQRDGVEKRPGSEPTSRDWSSFSMREHWLQHQESALAKPDLFSIKYKQ